MGFYKIHFFHGRSFNIYRGFLTPKPLTKGFISKNDVQVVVSEFAIFAQIMIAFGNVWQTPADFFFLVGGEYCGGKIY